MLDPATTTVAFIGTGVMGGPMAGHLMDAGYRLVVFNRTPSKAQPLVDRGARLVATAGDAASEADVVITMVGYPADVEEVYLSSGGVVERAREGAVLIDMTTLGRPPIPLPLQSSPSPRPTALPVLASTCRSRSPSASR